jgi:hypothetical protein
MPAINTMLQRITLVLIQVMQIRRKVLNYPEKFSMFIENHYQQSGLHYTVKKLRKETEDIQELYKEVVIIDMQQGSEHF